MILLRKTRRLLLIVMGSALALVADDRSNRTLTVTHADRFKVPAVVSIQLDHSFGEIDVEGWDLPEVEVTVTKSVEDLSREEGRAQKRLGAVQIAVKHTEGDTIISTDYPKQPGISHIFGRRGDVDITYRIYAPRSAKLVIEHNRGGLNIAGMSGDIHATVDRGQVTLISEKQYVVDAKCKIGTVYSDFDGHDQRHHFGEAFERQASPPAPNLYVRASFGDIMILKPSKLPRAE
jgi:hypothetical protein